MASPTMSQVAYFAQSTMIGMTLSMPLFIFVHHHSLIDIFSVYANLRNAAPGFNFTSTFFLRCLYLHEDGDPDYPMDGYLQGPLLLCVSFLPLHAPCISDNSFISDLLTCIYVSILCI